MVFDNKPCKWKRISQYYSSSHKGIDLANNEGTPVYAVASGKVAAASYGAWDESYGYMVAIDHGSGNFTNYAHLSKISVKAGQTVSRGQKIGEIGSTGNSTGNHLHFELHLGKKWNRVNPKPYIDAAGKTQTFSTGKTYTLQANLKVRTGPGTGYRQKKKSELTTSGQKSAQSGTYAVLKKGTRVTCQSIKISNNSTWIKIPSGWICAVQAGKIYVK